MNNQPWIKHGVTQELWQNLKSANPDASRVISRAFVKNKLNSIYSPEVEILNLTKGNRNMIKKYF